MNDPTHCPHGSTRVVYKTSSAGVRMYCRQCLDCGAKASTWLPKAKVERIWDVTPFDDALEQAGTDVRNRVWEERRSQFNAELAAKDQQWWVWYNRYLKSDAWRDKRRRVLERDGNTCQACLRRPATQVHHTTYVHVGMEPLFELVSVCDVCHDALHDKREKAG